ncbi:MAG: hypothetical protein AABX39_06025, partial [Nanoarchaeota archaeon]
NYTSERKYYWFSAAFGLITVSFLASSVVHLLIYLNFRESSTELFNLIGTGVVSFYVLLLITAYQLLLAVATDTHNKRLMLFIMLLSFTLIFTSSKVWDTFLIVAFITTLFIAINFFEKFTKRTTGISLLTFLSFASLAIAHGLFVSKIIFPNFINLFYVIGYFMIIFSYALLLFGMLRVLLLKPVMVKNERKKK